MLLPISLYLSYLLLFTGYSKLRNLVNLEDLSLVATSITRICRDWREDLTFLKYLDLKETYIEVLKVTYKQEVQILIIVLQTCKYI